MSGINKNKLTLDTSSISSSDTVGSYLVDAAGALITSTLISGKQALDVNIASPISLAVDLNGIYNVSTNPTPDNTGLIAFARAATPGLADQTQTVTSAPASSDAVVAANVHGMDVNSFGMGYNGTTWDRLTSTAGALNVNPLGNVADGAADSGNPLKVGTKALSGVLTAITSGNRANMISDLYRRLYINDSANIALKSQAVVVGTSAAQIDASPLAGRRRVIIQNKGNKSVYIGATGVTTASGTEIPSGASMNLEIGQDVGIFAISGTAAQDVRFFELA